MQNKYLLHENWPKTLPLSYGPLKSFVTDRKLLLDPCNKCLTSSFRIRGGRARISPGKEKASVCLPELNDQRTIA